MHVNGEKEAPSRVHGGPPRKYVTTACTACRESKIKCDGKQPQCGSCGDKRRYCEYKPGSDRRRQATSAHRAVRSLSRRITQLEDYIRLNGLPVPSANPENEHEINKLLESARLREEPSNQKTNTHRPFETDDSNKSTSAVTPPPSINWSRMEMSPTFHTLPEFSEDVNEVIVTDSGLRFNPSDQNEAVASNLHTPDWVIEIPNLAPSVLDNTDQALEFPVNTTFDFDITDDLLAPFSSNIRESSPAPHTSRMKNEVEEGCDYVINQVSDTAGSLRQLEDSGPRYFGATSHINLIDEKTYLVQSVKLSRGDHLHGEELIEMAGLDLPIDSTLTDHLTELYFAWQDSAFHLVDRDSYEEDKTKPGTEGISCCSESLTNSMCAFGSLYDPKMRLDHPESPPEFFARKARIWLEVELDSPRIATVQALTILSCYEAAQARDGRGWLYSGMAMRLSVDLGLNLDMTSYVQKGRISEREFEARKVAFWGSYIIDRHWGLYLGRPSFRIAADEITVPKPTATKNSPQHKPWRPHGLKNPLSICTGENSHVEAVKLVAQSWIRLCEIMNDLGPATYEKRGAFTPEERMQFETHLTELQMWHIDLPPELKLNGEANPPSLPHVLILHMQYHQFVIHVYRPFISKQRHQLLPSPPLANINYIQARSTCIQSAVSISTLLETYRSLYPLRFSNVQMVHIVFSASVILIFASISNLADGDGARLAAHLDRCCQALVELGSTFKHAGRILDILLAIKRQWLAKLLSPTILS